jgi:hypothetical protein
MISCENIKSWPKRPFLVKIGAGGSHCLRSSSTYQNFQKYRIYKNVTIPENSIAEISYKITFSCVLHLICLRFIFLPFVATRFQAVKQNFRLTLNLVEKKA